MCSLYGSVNRLDSLYFEAIAGANTGAVSLSQLLELHRQALKFRTLEMSNDAARSYERLFQIWRTLNEAQTAELPSGCLSFFCDVLSEYVELLLIFGRVERAEQVRQSWQESKLIKSASIEPMSLREAGRVCEK